MPTPPILQPTSFTSRDEIERELSAVGVENRIAESPVELIDWYVSCGTSTVLFYISNAGPVATLAANPWVRQKATTYAAMALTGHGGEPRNGTLVARWEECKEQLQLILEQKAEVPLLALTENYGGCPVVANVRVDPQMIPSTRVIRPASNDTPTGVNQPADYRFLYPWGWPFG